MSRSSRTDRTAADDEFDRLVDLLALPFVVTVAVALALGRTVGSYPLGVAVGAAAFALYAVFRLRLLPR